MIDEETIRQFYRRLNHQAYGLTELVAIDKDSGGIAATGFFDNENDFVSTCRAYNPRCNVYAGRNPRPVSISGIRNYMNIVQKKRAKDEDIRHLTAVSLDIDPIRKKGIPATKEQHQTVIRFALDLQGDFGGCADDSGNGAYLWISFETPIDIADDNFCSVKKKCEVWQTLLKEKYKPEEYGLRIDGCFDFSRIKRVIGTFNHKAQRVSGFVRRAEPSDKARDAILAVEVEEVEQKGFGKVALPPFVPNSYLPLKFKCLLKWDVSTRRLWEAPDPLGDTSRHDWMLGMSCVDAGITRPEELAAILVNNPHGKYRRDLRIDYVGRTVGKILKGNYNCKRRMLWLKEKFNK